MKYTLLDYSKDRIVYVGCIFKSFAHPPPLRHRIALLRSAALIFVLIKFVVSENDSFRFSLSFSGSFGMVFVEPGAAPPVHAKISGTKLLCSTSKILCWYFNNIQDICGRQISFGSISTTAFFHNFSIFESVIFSVSVVMFLFIRVCSVSAISGSLFSIGSQSACDHS